METIEIKAIDFISSSAVASLERLEVFTLQIRPNNKVSLGDVLIDLRAVNKDGSKHRVSIAAPIDGRVASINVSEGQAVSLRDTLMVIAGCNHPVVVKGTCITCLTDLTSTNLQDERRKRAFIAHSSRDITVSIKEAERIDAMTKKRLVQGRKLSLLVDIDHTLIDFTTDFSGIVPKHDDPANDDDQMTSQSDAIKMDPTLAPLQSKMYQEETSVYVFNLPESPNALLGMKVRPGVHDMLKRLSDKYELHVYSWGTLNYIRRILSVVDPERQFFADRIVCREDSKKNIARLFPCDDSMVLVMDDRADVWESTDALLQVSPYFFFSIQDYIESIDAPKSGADLPSKPSAFVPPFVEKRTVHITLSETEYNTLMNNALHGAMIQLPMDLEYSTVVAEQAEQYDDKLMSSTIKRATEVLELVHQDYYEKIDASISVDVKDCLKAYKAKVLQGFRLFFSGIVSIGTVPALNPQWNLALEYGAQVIDWDLKSEPAPTHLVVRFSNTDKHKAVIAYNMNHPTVTPISVVNIKWLYDSVLRLSRQNEDEYDTFDDGYTASMPNRLRRTSILMPSPDLARSPIRLPSSKIRLEDQIPGASEQIDDDDVDEAVEHGFGSPDEVVDDFLADLGNDEPLPSEEDLEHSMDFLEEVEEHGIKRAKIDA